MLNRTCDGNSKVNTSQLITARYEELSKHVNVAGDREGVLTAITKFIGLVEAQGYVFGEFNKHIAGNDPAEVDMTNGCICIVGVAKDIYDPLVLHVTFMPSGRNGHLVTGEDFLSGKLRLASRVLRKSPLTPIEEIITFDVFNASGLYRAITPEKFLFDKLSEIENKVRRIGGNSYAKEVHSIASQALSDYGDMVMPDVYPVQWNGSSTIVPAEQCNDHPDVRPVSQHAGAKAMALDNGADTIDRVALDYIGFISTPTTLLLVYPGDWVVQAVRGRYEVYPNELFETLF